MLNVVCVDDEQQALQTALALCGGIPEIDSVRGFSCAREALNHVARNGCDLALLDVGLPDMDGITLARKIREIRPEAEIVFVTASGRYAVDAWAIHARGYVVKPLTAARLREEVDCVLALSRPAAARTAPPAHIEVKTFGNFDVLVDGEPVHFQRAKAKELLALLVERQGQCVTREEAYRVLWEDRPYDRSAQKQLDVILRSLRATLEEYGIGGLLTLRRGAFGINPRLVSCDMYRFLLGDVAALGEYRGEYMASYPWASLQEAYLARRIENLS